MASAIIAFAFCSSAIHLLCNQKKKGPALFFPFHLKEPGDLLPLCHRLFENANFWPEGWPFLISCFDLFLLMVFPSCDRFLRLGFDPLSHGVFSSSRECRVSESAAVEPKSSGTRRLLLVALVWKAAAFACCVGCGACLAADDSIRASGLGLKVATVLRRLGLADELVVFAIAALPVLELRGAIPVGYWMQLHPVTITFLAVLGFVAFLAVPIHSAI